MEMEIDNFIGEEDGGDYHLFKTPFMKTNHNCVSSLPADGFLSVSPESINQTFDGTVSDVSSLIDCDDHMDAAHLRVNLKYSETSEDSGVFSEVTDSPERESDFRDSKQRLGETSPQKRLAIPYKLRRPKYICLSPETPIKKELVKKAFSHTFQSTPLDGSGIRSPKLRRNRRFSRDIFYKRRSSEEEEVPLPFRVPLTGQEHVDFLAQLGHGARLQPALDAILGHLDPEDLCRASVVSRVWKNIIDSVSASKTRKKSFLEQRVQIKENLHQSGKKSDLGDSLPLRGQLISIQNINRSVDTNQVPPRSPPVSPSKVRFNLFLKEGQKLETGETLVQCPRCKLPSRFKKGQHSARCTRRGCQFYFCVQCLCMFHEDRPCPVSVKHRKRQAAIGSRESRRNLQRLCQ